MKYGEMYPLSNFMPSITSSSSSRVLPSFTVMTPFLPTFFMAVDMRSPISLSPLAEIVATWREGGREKEEGRGRRRNGEGGEREKERGSEGQRDE